MKQILVFTEEHGVRCFDASSQELINKAALKVLTERFKDGYWYRNPEEPEASAEAALTQDQINALPTAHLRDRAQREVDDFQQRLKWYNRAQKEYEAIVQCVSTRDAAAAFRLLNARRKYEYEGFTIEQVESV